MRDAPIAILGVGPTGGEAVIVGGRGPNGPPAGHPATLPCFSHLRWDRVHQRPQYLLQPHSFM